MTIPNGPDLPGHPADPALSQPPYNPKPSLWSSVPRSVLAGAAAVAVVLVILVTTLSGGDSDGGGAGASGAVAAEAGADTTTPATFVPLLYNAQFTGWRDTKTQQPVAPPQHIRITGSLDLSDQAELIGYGAAEQRLPKHAGATTDSSFPIPTGSPPVRMYTDIDNVLHLSWLCQFVVNDPDDENCQEVYHIAFDVSGSEPVVVTASNSVRDLRNELIGAPYTTSTLVSVVDPSELPTSTLGVDKGTGADTVGLLAAAQPRETSAKVYFVVADSLKLYFGELEPSR